MVESETEIVRVNPTSEEAEFLTMQRWALGRFFICCVALPVKECEAPSVNTLMLHQIPTSKRRTLRLTRELMQH